MRGHIETAIDNLNIKQSETQLSTPQDGDSKWEFGMKPRIGIISGEPGDIGPELIAKLLNDAETCEKADILLIGDQHLFELGQTQAGMDFAMTSCDGWQDDWASLPGFALHAMDTISSDAVTIAEVTHAGGHSALTNLNCALEMARDGIIDAIMFGPFNKAGLIEAGLGHEDELHYMAEFLGVELYFRNEYAQWHLDKPCFQPYRAERRSQLHQ